MEREDSTMNKKLYPIGTIVKLDEKSKILFMIVGYLPQNKNGDKRDYTAVRYPMGVYDNRMFFFFNQSDIFEVLHSGYENEDFYAMAALAEKSKLFDFTSDNDSTGMQEKKQ